MELVITLLILVLAIQSVYMYFIVKKQDEIIDMHNNFVEVTIICIEELATAIDDIEQHIEETQ
jgi:uncharacterized membrane protein YukC